MSTDIEKLAHDLNNKLAIIRGFIRMIRKNPSDTDRVEKMAADIEKATEEALQRLQEATQTNR